MTAPAGSCTIGCKIPGGVVLTVQQTFDSPSYPIPTSTTIALVYGSNPGICYATWLAWNVQENQTVTAGIAGLPATPLFSGGPANGGPNDLLTTGAVYLISVP